MQILKGCEHGNKKIMGCVQCRKLYQARRILARDPAKYLWESAKARARRRGVPFTIQISDIVIPKTCVVLGIPIDWSTRDHAASIDEIIQGEGYVPGNICVVSGRANRIKSDSTLGELKALVAYVEIRSSKKFGTWKK